jgi:hypothetical protein
MDENPQRELPTPEACLPLGLRKRRLRRWEASEYLLAAHGLTYSKATLAKMACVGGGPGFQRCNRTPLYPREELDAWAESKLSRVIYSTSEIDR